MSELEFHLCNPSIGFAYVVINRSSLNLAHNLRRSFCCMPRSNASSSLGSLAEVPSAKLSCLLGNVRRVNHQSVDDQHMPSLIESPYGTTDQSLGQVHVYEDNSAVGINDQSKDTRPFSGPVVALHRKESDSVKDFA